MKIDRQLAEEIDLDFHDEGYFNSIEPPWLEQKDKSFFATDVVPEIPRAIQVMDFDLGLADEESCNWEDYVEADVDKPVQDEGSEDNKNGHDQAAGGESRKINIFAQSAKPYNHESEVLMDACGITRESYRSFCEAFKATVSVARAEEPEKRSREIEEFEKLMMPYPRELAFYITELIADIVEYNYLRSTLRHLLREPHKEAAKENNLEKLECEGSA